MRDEPSTQHLPLATLNTLTTQSYLLMTHLASARRLIAQSGADGDGSALADAMEATSRGLTHLLDPQNPDENPERATAAPCSIPALAHRLAHVADDIRVLMGAARALGVQGIASRNRGVRG